MTRETTMSLMTRAVAAFAVLTVAAIPVAALTIKNTSGKEVSVGVDNGSEEAVYQIPAGGSVDVTQDCSSECAVTGPWGFSRLVAQNATISTDGDSLVTATAAPPAQGLVPQNPVAEPADAQATAATAPDAAPAKAAPAKARSKRANKPRSSKQAQKGPGAGSFQMLFEGPKK
jgi:hypothetical protein